MNLMPCSRYTRTVLDCKKLPFLCEFLDEPDTPLVIWVAPWGNEATVILVSPVLCVICSRIVKFSVLKA